VCKGFKKEETLQILRLQGDIKNVNLLQKILYLVWAISNLRKENVCGSTSRV
jgi:hypothetical protein